MERQRGLLIKTINKLRESLVLEDDPIRKIRYEEQLLEKEGELQHLEIELRQLFGLDTLTGQNLLASKIAQLHVGRELGVLDLVNCNREQEIQGFWERYDRLEEQRFQFYFLTSCETQKPSSFAERMLYEYLIEELNEAADAIYYRRDPREQELGRPLIDPLPRGRNLANSQNAFRKYFAELWAFSEQQSFEEYLQTGLPRSEYDAVALFFKLDASRWQTDVTLPYLEWMIQTLQSVHQEVPRVLVFLEINFAGAHLQRDVLQDDLAFKGIKTVLSQYPSVAHLLPFSPVGVPDLKRWFSDLNTRNTHLIDGLLQSFAKSFNKEELQLYQHKAQLNMNRVEMLQWEVFKLVNRTSS